MEIVDDDPKEGVSLLLWGKWFDYPLLTQNYLALYFTLTQICDTVVLEVHYNEQNGSS